MPYHVTTTAYGDCIVDGPVSVSDTTLNDSGQGVTAQTDPLWGSVIRCVVVGDGGYGECRV